MASNNEDPTPLAPHLLGGSIETPADPSRHQTYIGSQQQTQDGAITPRAHHDAAANDTFTSNAYHTNSEEYYGGEGAVLSSASSHSTAVPTARPAPNARTSPDAHTNFVGASLVKPEAAKNEGAGPVQGNGYLQKSTWGGPVEEHVVLEDDSSDS
ncbi:hypothetical protein EJ02DRAFT_424052 [Clathrospora elynae]|uniref:Uncharacterized protein n=1 Tax=Clathrospora elynae TaxID=706981 RepID=A0A6A5SKT1_9PLEO|nr:hypothetical protein EJ02DRAFT_424052 [Clathrospora elynae]